MEDKAQEILLTVGEIYPNWQTKQDGFRLEWSDTGLILYAMLNGISEEEEKQFSTQNKLTLRYTVIDDVCYFTFMFGNMPWADCPFSPTVYKNIMGDAPLPDIEDEKGLSLTVLLIDSGTGRLCHIRLIGLGHDFSLGWTKWAKEAVKKDLSFEEYNRQIDETYRQYASVDLAVKGGNEGNEYVVGANV